MSQTNDKQPEVAPDPDEDDLDDLDDVLDEFSKKTASPAAVKPTASPAVAGPARPEEPAAPNEEVFTKQLEDGMKSLIGELDANPEMQKEFEKMMQELIAAGSATTDDEATKHISKAAEATPGTKAEKDSFNDTIRKTMERMQASGDQASAAAAAAPNEDDYLAQMMKELASAGGGGEEDFNKMLMGMMAQLTNKEILYEPMKELHDKFPTWMEKNKDTAKTEDMTKFKEQQRLVADIVGRFERPGYNDSNDEDREFIVDRMQKMQAQGSPPPDLVGDMSAAQEAFGEFEGGCPTQ